MTDKAPERIWATGDGTIGSWSASEVRMKIHMPDGWETEYVRADIYNEAKMQSLADLGQAQDALEAQKKAEAERDKLQAFIDDAQCAYSNLDLTVEFIRHARETEND